MKRFSKKSQPQKPPEIASKDIDALTEEFKKRIQVLNDENDTIRAEWNKLKEAYDQKKNEVKLLKGQLFQAGQELQTKERILKDRDTEAEQCEAELSKLQREAESVHQIRERQSKQLEEQQVELKTLRQQVQALKQSEQAWTKIGQTNMQINSDLHKTRQRLDGQTVKLENCETKVQAGAQQLKTVESQLQTCEENAVQASAKHLEQVNLERAHKHAFFQMNEERSKQLETCNNALTTCQDDLNQTTRHADQFKNERNLERAHKHAQLYALSKHFEQIQQQSARVLSLVQKITTFLS